MSGHQPGCEYVPMLRPCSCSTPSRGRTIREAIGMALEVVPGPARAWTADERSRDALRAHVLAWVGDYARHRGVILDEADIASELDAIIAGLRGPR